MKIHRVTQRTPEWLALRAGIPTASEAGLLVAKSRKKDVLWEVATGKGVDTYLAAKLVERWTGRPLAARTISRAMDAGTVLETHALPKFELETELELEQVGFVTTDDGNFGFSPDSMVKDAIEGVEAKCPEAWTHVKYLLAGELPAEYFGQVQSSMYATGAQHWWFMSYCPTYPELILKVPRDDRYISVLADALEQFQFKLEGGWKKLVRLNGGVEPTRKAITVEEAEGIVTQTLEGVDPASIDEFFQTKAYERMNTP